MEQNKRIKMALIYRCGDNKHSKRGNSAPFGLFLFAIKHLFVGGDHALVHFVADLGFELGI